MNEMELFNADLKSIMIPREVGSEGHGKVREYIVSKLTEYGFTVELDSFKASTPLGVKEFHNIVATYNPSKSTYLVSGSSVISGGNDELRVDKRFGCRVSDQKD
eukprot:TRINITY_DN10033_c0_g1_i1.p1 TRINITY_DN10033_c0_g1~~TRINITY_DN10033_c0_g1_i1.p1  ORF type:complete len:104 (-),score=14.08 TRINITY_DN10033_c0_g1_i1:225-536(-)